MRTPIVPVIQQPPMELRQSQRHKTHLKDPTKPSPAAASTQQPVVTVASSEKPTFTSISHEPGSPYPEIPPTPSPKFSLKEETDTEYDSDCLVIVECDPADYQLSPGDGQEMSQCSTGSNSAVYNCNTTGEKNEESKPGKKDSVPNPASKNNHINNTTANSDANVCKRKQKQQHNPHPPTDESNPTLSASPPISNYTHHKLHNLPIHELKKKLAYCPICYTQCTNHKIANLCLNKHGMRQCWLCLDVIPNTKDSYFHHCVTNHAVRPSSDMVACPYCHKYFDFRQGINQHIVKVHFSEDTSFFNTTACLSPASLVDIYTGQSRSNSNGSSSGGIGNNNSNSNNNNEQLLPTKEETGTNTPQSPSGSTAFHKSDEINEDDSASVIFEREIKIVRNPEEGVGGTVSQLSLLRRHPNRRGSSISAATRESVIRETSSWLETGGRRSSSSYNIIHEHQQQSSSAMERESHLNASRRPQSNPHPSQVQNIQQQAGDGGSTPAVVVCMGESNLTLPQRPSSDPLHHHHLLPSYASTFPACSDKSIQQQPPQYNEEAFYNTPQSNIILSGGGYTSYNDQQQQQNDQQLLNQNKKNPYPQSNDTDRTVERDTPSVLQEDFQKVLEESGGAKAPTDYFDSVKSMLKTVADYGPPQDQVESETGEIPNHFHPYHHHHQQQQQHHLGMYHTGESSSSSAVPSSTAMTNLTPDSERSLGLGGVENEDNNHFKVPSHAGVKRRILTKWDEHQEKKCEPGSYYGHGGGGIPMYPPQPSNLENVSKYHQHSNYPHPQPFSLEGSLRAPGGLHDMPPEDQQFWEQILRESSAMHKTPQSQDLYHRNFQEIQYRISLHQQQQQQAGHFHNQNRSAEYYCPSPAIGQHLLKPEGDMATQYLNLPYHLQRESGQTNNANNNRQFGYNNGLATHLPTFPHNQITTTSTGEIIPSSQLMVYNPVQAHKQYEYRIIPQSTSMGNGGTVVPNHSNEILISSHPHPQHPPVQDVPSGLNLSTTPASNSTLPTSSTHYNSNSNMKQQLQQFPLNYQHQPDLTSSSNSASAPTPRKRKSAFPNRVIQQPKINPGDSVVVQNPFEEEEITLHNNKIRQPIMNNNSSNDIIQLSPTSNLGKAGGNAGSNKLPSNLTCQRVSNTPTLMSTQQPTRSAAVSQFDAIQMHQQQMLQHQQNVQIQINHHHYNQQQLNRLSNNAPRKLSAGELFYQQQQQLAASIRMKNHQIRGSLDNNIRVPMPMMSPVPGGQRNSSSFDSRSHQHNNGGTTNASKAVAVSRSHPKVNGNREASNNDSWPFAIAPRYQDRCRSIAFHVKEMEMEMQQKLREKCKRNLISSTGEGESTHHQVAATAEAGGMWQ